MAICKSSSLRPNFIGRLTKSMSWAAFQLHFNSYYFTSNKMLNVWATTEFVPLLHTSQFQDSCFSVLGSQDQKACFTAFCIVLTEGSNRTYITLRLEIVVSSRGTGPVKRLFCTSGFPWNCRHEGTNERMFFVLLLVVLHACYKVHDILPAS